MSNPDEKVTPLFGATPAAILAAATKAVATAERAYLEAAMAREQSSAAALAASKAERGAWAAHAAIDKARRENQAEHADLGRKLDQLAERTAKEIIRLTAEQTRLARQGGSSPELTQLAQMGIRIAELHVEDEATEVRERKEKAQHRREVRALVITWATRAAVVLGPLLTLFLTRHCQ